MDESFLSKQEVVEASRDFVCIRLATYEDPEEAEYLKKIYTPRSGVLENTTFAILTPNADRQLIRSGRGPNHSFRNSRQMAQRMGQIAAEFRNPQPPSSLPAMKNVDLGLNVAACDGLPMIVVYGEQATELANLQKQLSRVIWKESLAGQYIVASTSKAEELKPLLGSKQQGGIFVVEPDQFGLSGKVVDFVSSADDATELSSRLQTAVARYQPPKKSHQSHVRFGIQLGVEWESAIPETDPMSVRAKERARGK